MLTTPPAVDEIAKVNEHMEVMTKAQPDGLWQVMHNILATKSQRGGFHGELDLGGRATNAPLQHSGSKNRFPGSRGCFIET